jgi:hypothetical protein
MKRLKLWQIVLVVLLALILFGGIAFVIWGSNPLPADPQALSALENDSLVAIYDEPWLVFRPQSIEPTGGFIFYPGGRVQPEAYAPSARAIAESGYLVVIPPMPLNLAVFAPEVANQIIAAYPEVECWVIGGHSLGGAMAARYAYRHPQAIQGLVLWAAYPAESDDLSSSDLAVVSIFASEDGLADEDTMLASRPLLPAGTSWVFIEGGNHAGFGWYGPQSGDNLRTISLEDQQEQVITATLDLLEIACPLTKGNQP